MSSQEMKKKEKGKEIVTSEETRSTSSVHHHFHHKEKKVSMVLSEQEIEFILQSTSGYKETYKEKLEKSKKDIEKGKRSSSSKITPDIFYTSDEKARLRWSSDLHECFVNAVERLGGPNKATPKSVKEMMEVEGISLHHVKSHLQKYRLGKCTIRDGTNQYLRRFKSARDIKTCASVNSSISRPQVKIKPRCVGAVKPKPKKEKEVEGSLYRLIENDRRLQRCRRKAQKMQKAFAKSQRNMFETQYCKASTTPTLPSQHNDYVATSTSISQQPFSYAQEQWLLPLMSYHFPEGETNPFTMNYSQQPSIIIPQNIDDGMACLSLSEFTHQNTSNTFSMYQPSMYPTQGYLQFNDGHIYNMACLPLSEFTQNTSNTFSMYEPSMYPTQGNLQFNDGQIYNMAQGFINPYMTIEPQWMDAQQQLHLNDGCVIHDSYGNATFISPTVPSTVDSLHQDTFNNVFLFSTTPPSIPAPVPHPTYNSYPPYNTLEVVEAQLNALQESRENQTQETFPRETNLSSSVTRDEVDPVDKYIDWAKVEERDIDELDPVEVLEALGFGVSP